MEVRTAITLAEVLHGWMWGAGLRIHEKLCTKRNLLRFEVYFFVRPNCPLSSLPPYAGPEGKLFVTDADRIELSNLSRQFLFREHNVGQPKSRAAAAMALKMNPSFNVEALELYVGAKSEGG